MLRKRKKKTVTRAGKVEGSFPRKRLDRASRSGISIKPSHKGLLHQDTGTPAGEKISGAKIQKALHSSDPAVRKRANFARNAKKWNK